jgi:erythromycin esterase-like protein
VTSFRFAGTGAIATVRTESSRASEAGRLAGVSTFRDTWSLTIDGWRLKERVFLTGRFALPPTDTQTTRLVAADLKQLAAPVATPEAGHTIYDLAPFGNAIRDARVVALGQAAEGTREFLQMKLRLLEYLVKEKGFTVLAVSAADDAAAGIDRYIKTGQGDARTALAGMKSPPWDSQEAWHAIEWLRAFNQALIPHPTLSFVAFHEPPAAEDHPGERMVYWTTNRQVREIAAPRGGAGSRMYRVGFAFRRGELRANGFRNGNATGLASHAVPSLPEGSGDSVLGAAGMPLFFLDIRSVEPMTTLGRWLAEPHLFLSVGASWNQDGPENHLRPATLSKAYDGLIFVDEGHAAKGLEAPHVSNY